MTAMTLPTTTADALLRGPRVHVFDAASAAGRACLDDLRGRSDVIVVDALELQIADLARARAPSRHFTDAQIAQCVREYAPEGLDAAGCWVVFPATRTLVHLLLREDFRALRADRNRPRITAGQQRRLGAASIAVAGLSVGQASAVTLALEGIGGHFNLADPDHLSLSNMNRVRAGLHELGLSKVELAARQIEQIDPFAGITLFEDGVTAENVDAFLHVDGRPVSVLVEECDSFDVKVLLRSRARALGIPVVMETSDRGMIDVERFDLEPERPLLHGLLGDLDVEQLAGLSTKEKTPYAVAVVDITRVSAVAAAGFVEVGATIEAWPQLASAVALGGAVVTDVVRRLLLGGLTTSGRWYVDLAQLLCESTSVDPHRAPPLDLDRTGFADLRPSVNADIGQGPEPTAAELAAVCSGARLAPSGANCQPWHLGVDGKRVKCDLDPRRLTTVLDAGFRAGYLALGSALENAIIVARSFGLDHTLLRTVSDADPAGWVLEFVRGTPPTQAEQARADAVARRHTNRLAGTGGTLPEAVADELTQLAIDGGTRLQLRASDADLRELGDLIGRTDRLRLLSTEMRGHLLSELRWTRADVRVGDGIDVVTTGSTPSELALLSLLRHDDGLGLVSDLDGGDRFAENSRELVASSAALALLTIDGHGPTAMFQAGRVLERIWLAATMHDIAVHPVTVLPCLLDTLRFEGPQALLEIDRERVEMLRARYERMYDTSPSETQVLLFRLSYAPPPPCLAMRRPAQAE